MSIKVQIVQHADFLEFVFSGSFDPPQAIEQLAYLFDVCRLTGIYKVLIGVAGLGKERGFMEVFFYTTHMVNECVKLREEVGAVFKLAILGRPLHEPIPGNEMIDELQLPIEVFEERSDAMQWLAE